MDFSEGDEIPMLSSATFRSDHNPRVFSSRTRSASMSIPSNSRDSFGDEQNLVGFTGPLINERRSSFVPMSGPLYASRNNEFVFHPPRAALRPKNTKPEMERDPSIDRNGKNDWPSDNDCVVKHEHLLRSGPLGMCNDPYCTTCPLFNSVKRSQKQLRTSEVVDAKFHNMLYGDAKGCAKRMCSFLTGWIPGVMSPHAKFVQWWNKFFVFSCLCAAFLDPLFHFVVHVHEGNKCIVLDWPMTKILVCLRTITDVIHLLHIFIQFRVAYVAPESTVTGAGDLVDDPKKIACNYFRGYLFIDVLVVLPLPQIIVYSAYKNSIGSAGANYGTLIQVAILVQYFPRLLSFLPFVAGASPTGSIFESAWAPFVTNLIILIVTSHLIGSCWYFFGLERVNNCFEDVCPDDSVVPCKKFISCGYGNDYKVFEKDPKWEQWKNHTKTAACLQKQGNDFGIFEAAVNLTTRKNVGTRYIYSLFWGLQQISTLAGSQVPSYSASEVVFTMGIIVWGLFLFSLLIGNMQNFLQGLKRRRVEISLRRCDVEQWMSHRRLPLELRRQVRESERFNWAATRGVNEDMLMENLPEDLQRNIRCHLFKFVKKVRIFQMLDERIIDAICERLRTKTYIKGSKILFHGGVVDKMVFIIRRKMESIGEDLIAVRLSEGNVCGEELLTWCLEHSSVNTDGKRIRIPRHRLLSSRLVRCLTNVEAFVLRSADLEEVISLFARFLRSPRVQGAIRYESPYWRGLAARRIQVAWRYRKKRVSRADSSSPPRNWSSV